MLVCPPRSHTCRGACPRPHPLLAGSPQTPAVWLTVRCHVIEGVGASTAGQLRGTALLPNQAMRQKVGGARAGGSQAWNLMFL